MSSRLSSLVLVAVVLGVGGCGGGSSAPTALPDVVVNSLSDEADPPFGTTTLRSALAAAASGQRIVFDAVLDGGIIDLVLVDSEDTVLKGEVMGMREEPSGPVSYLVGYFERNYGRSALYARKDVVIDASALPSGITVRWAGTAGDDARVLAVYGDLFLANVTITGGRSVTEDISTGDPEDQPWTLARGGGVAVWGTAYLRRCTVFDNHCTGDFDSSRDRGAFGGGVYGDILKLEDCVVCGNTILGAGAAGGGVFSVGGAETETGATTEITRCAISGNRIAALFTYGAGVYSDGGGIGNAGTLQIRNTTIAMNAVVPVPKMPPFLYGIGYWRGGGVYMSNGYLDMRACTVVDNEVSGYARTDDLGKPNLAGGVAATIGNAHAVEEMIIGHSIVAGNVVHELGMDGLPANTYDHDIFTGSLLYFRSLGYNRIGVLDFQQILVPVGTWNWRSLCRRHYPKTGDQDGIAMEDVLDLAGGAFYDASLPSAGVAPGTPTLLSCLPRGSALDQIPDGNYSVYETFAEYMVASTSTDDFLAITLARLEAHFAIPGFAAAFTADFELFLQTVDTDEDTPGTQPYLDPDDDPVLTLADVGWYGPAETWVKELVNYPWIEFWHRLDAALAAESIPGLGPEILGDVEWDALYDAGSLAENPDITMVIFSQPQGTYRLLPEDQVGSARPANTQGDIGAMETR